MGLRRHGKLDGMGLILPADTYANQRRKTGKFFLNEPEAKSAPHYWEACRLETELRHSDDMLRMIAMYYPTGFRWGIYWSNREGEEILVRTCENFDKSYCIPDMRWVKDLQHNDMWGANQYKLQRHIETEDQRLDRIAAQETAEAQGVMADIMEKDFRDAGWSQKEEGDPIRNFSFEHGEQRAKKFKMPVKN